MKRTLITTLALGLAALALTAAAPIAVAAPGSGPLPAMVITSTIEEQHGFTVEATPPSSASGTLTLVISGTRNARVEAFAGRNIEAARETYTIGETEPDGTLILRLQAPAEGWRPETVYQWKALGTELGADAYARGTFTTPTWNPSPTKPPTTDPQEGSITATVVAPSSRHASVVITVRGAYDGNRIEAGVERAKTGGEALIRLGQGAHDESPVSLVVPAPNEGWEERTQYDWWVRITDREFSHRGQFMTPAWTDANDPAQPRFRTDIQLPTANTAPLVFVVTGAEPGVGVHVSLGRSVDEQADGLGRAVSDANGRAVLTLRPGNGGWRSGARYYWFVWAEYENADNHELLRSLGGSLTMPTWTRDGGVKQPGTPPKPKDRIGGVSKTGV